MIPNSSDLEYPRSAVIVGGRNVKGNGHRSISAFFHSSDYYTYVNAHLTDSSNMAWICGCLLVVTEENDIVYITVVFWWVWFDGRQRNTEYTWWEGGTVVLGSWRRLHCYGLAAAVMDPAAQLPVSNRVFQYVVNFLPDISATGLAWRCNVTKQYSLTACNRNIVKKLTIQAVKVWIKDIEVYGFLLFS